MHDESIAILRTRLFKLHDKMAEAIVILITLLCGLRLLDDEIKTA